MSVQARDRKIENWYFKISNGEIKLPRFQRHEAWDKWRIESLMTTILHNLPLGITLILEVDQEQFISKYITTAELDGNPKVTEHLLDGQQRLTAIWRVLHNNYDSEKYFLYLEEYDETWQDDGDDVQEERVFRLKRYRQKRTNKLMPLWADDPEEMFKRGCIPMELFKPIDIGDDLDDWVDSALNHKKPKEDEEDLMGAFEKFEKLKNKLSNQIRKFRETIFHYNLPYLALPSNTPKETALNVFINMNTNSKPLSQYDIIVAEIEGLKSTSLHKLQSDLNDVYPSIGKYFDLSYLILYTSALMQEKLPNNKGIWDMDKNILIENWDRMVDGLSQMTNFMQSQKIYDQERLPTNAVLAVISALYTNFPPSGDQAGHINILLKRYLWSSFFTDRYENSAASRAYADFISILSFLEERTKPNSETKYTEKDIPIFDQLKFPICTEEELLSVSWPKRASIRGRGILAVANYFKAYDFADGKEITPANISGREYHHIFPDALIKEANNFLDEDLESYIALNCALITDTTNRVIGRKDPYNYLKERNKWVDEEIVRNRLASHLIPFNELKEGMYENYDSHQKAEKVKKDYINFITKRASLIYKAMQGLVKGKDINVKEIIEKEDIRMI